MPQASEVEDQVEDDYNEEADSDFEAASDDAVGNSSSSDDDEKGDEKPKSIKRHDGTQQHKVAISQDLGELDSGDEATIKEQKKARKKQKRKGEVEDDGSGQESEGWRARTRAMRDKEKIERKLNKLASIKNSTIDVDKVWEEMNRSVKFEPPRIEQEVPDNLEIKQDNPLTSSIDGHTGRNDKENVPSLQSEEFITIKRTYKFAGEVHTEEKTVPKSSAEARLYLNQQAVKPQATPDGRIIQRPLRKISRFDPNYNNMEAFKSKWTVDISGGKVPTGPKLNVVEKSKMDWAVHVDAEGLKEELDEHSKAKEGYLTRMDFLNEVEQRKEEEARAARIKAK